MEDIRTPSSSIVEGTQRTGSSIESDVFTSQRSKQEVFQKFARVKSIAFRVIDQGLNRMKSDRTCWIVVKSPKTLVSFLLVKKQTT